ncbi:NAD(P)/FAD-dependent oxidoreductase [Roseicyclus mahoneyensis]|uniref:Glycine/D-amino acid oxidase-like deaminating enzyme n=1 Tax=Roseicyclus mahoneyensis TaxID=164332 RepID=A0A316GI27_9RHOB|nr:FAD-binding oxidoreductase [Roseicyclus mahoneyensis]PWK60230.1 glycine/D-amino acid oxidase-like deaminating enzyme [Roseicyclus mahoneyensis]
MAEIRVFGAGIFGLSVAWECARRGALVEVVDPFGIGAGSSGGLVGALAPHVPENWNAKKQVQFDALDLAANFWAEVAEVGGTDPGYGRTGRLQPVADDAALELARARAVTAAALWQGRYDWQVVAAADFPGLLDSPTGWLIRDTLTARLHPRRACAALAAAIGARGGQIRVEATAKPMIEVWATGAAGLSEVSEALGRTVGTGVKGQAALFHANLPDAPQLFVEALHIVPHADGTVAIGSTSERDYTDPASTDAQLDALIDIARRLCPALRDAPVIDRWAGIRPRARSRAPMLGAHPARPGAFIANGGFKIGFGMAPMVARLMADLILEGRDTIPGEFRPEASL